MDKKYCKTWQWKSCNLLKNFHRLSCIQHNNLLPHFHIFSMIKILTWQRFCCHYNNNEPRGWGGGGQRSCPEAGCPEMQTEVRGQNWLEAEVNLGINHANGLVMLRWNPKLAHLNVHLGRLEFQFSIDSWLITSKTLYLKVGLNSRVGRVLPVAGPSLSV